MGENQSECEGKAKDVSRSESRYIEKISAFKRRAGLGFTSTEVKTDKK